MEESLCTYTRNMHDHIYTYIFDIFFFLKRSNQYYFNQKGAITVEYTIQNADLQVQQRKVKAE